MRPADQLHWLWRSLISNRMRTALTALGIAIGIAAVTGLTAIGEGVRLYMLDTFSQFGSRLVAVTPGKTGTQGMGGILSSVRPLSVADAQSLKNLAHVEAVVPVISGTAEIRHGKYTRSTDVYGVGAQAAEAWHFNVAQGRFLPDDDARHARAFAVLGSKAREELFGQDNPLGAFIDVGGYRFRVVGVMESKGQLLGFDLDDAVYIPVRRALQLFNRESLMEIDVVFTPAIDSDTIAERIRQHLIRRHHQEDFTLFTQEDMLKTLDRILGIIKIGIGALGGISLLVGAVGVFTIMSIALQERIGEIGLLRALGYTPRQVLRLFLYEAVLLTTVGGLCGILAMALLVLILHLSVPGLPMKLQPAFLLFALGLSAVVGAIAGGRPAWQAARLSPIEALRDE